MNTQPVTPYESPLSLFGTLEEKRAKLAAFQDEVLALQAANSGTPVSIEPSTATILASLTLELFSDLCIDEPTLFTYSPRDVSEYSHDAVARYWHTLHWKKYFLENKDALTPAFFRTLEPLLLQLKEAAERMEDTPRDKSGNFLPGYRTFMTPLVYLLRRPQKLVGDIWDTFVHSVVSRSGMYPFHQKELNDNAARLMSGHEKFVHPSQSDFEPLTLVKTYLGNSPFGKLLSTRVPIKWEYNGRFHHTHILGGTGAGKTTLMEWAIYHDMISEYIAGAQFYTGLVVIDPHSDLIKKIARSQFGERKRRIILIDPRDTEYPAAINLFAVNQKRQSTYDAATREQVQMGVMQTFDYFFSGLVGAELTGKQAVAFRYLTQLLLTLPSTMGRNATLVDMLHLTNDPTPYLGAIERLPDVQRQFFAEYVDPKNSNWRETKDQVRNRLHMVFSNPVLSRFFSSAENKIDLFEEMNRGSVILIDTAKDYLQGSSGMFGRIFISLILRAIIERAVLEPDMRRPAFLYVDEAASYFDSSIDDLLTDARKFKVGCTFAHHNLEQANAKLRASLSGAGSKFAGNVSQVDARAMAGEMRTTPEFIQDQPKFSFAAYLKGVVPHAVPISVQPSPLSQKKVWMSEDQWGEFIALNRHRVSGGPKRQEPQPLGPDLSAQTVSKETSREW